MTAIAIGLGLRVWWYWPETLHGGPHVSKLERQGSTYSLRVSQKSSLSNVVDLGVLEGYSPSNHLEFLERLADRPSKFVKEDDRHHFVEYMGQYGRTQFHSADDREGSITYWLEFFPASLPIDSFLDHRVAIALDLTDAEFKVQIPMDQEQAHMSIIAKKRMVDRIVWTEH